MGRIFGRVVAGFLFVGMEFPGAAAVGVAFVGFVVFAVGFADYGGGLGFFLVDRVSLLCADVLGCAFGVGAVGLGQRHAGRADVYAA